MKQQKTTIGRSTDIELVAEKNLVVPAKVDTGADSSSIWASQLSIDEGGRLSFVLFDESSPHYTGKLHVVDHYDALLIRSSNGKAQVRYRVQLAVRIHGRLVRGTFTLADRSKNSYPVLVGCRLLKGRFIVDVEQGFLSKLDKVSDSLTRELRKNPQLFFRKYHNNNQRGDVDL